LSADRRALTVRLDDTRARQIELIARAADSSVNDEIAAAVVDRIEARKQDAEFQKRLHELLEKEHAAARDLAPAD
jgi:hypothetical protein